MPTYIEFIAELPEEYQNLVFGSMKELGIQKACQAAIDAMRVFDPQDYDRLKARWENRSQMFPAGNDETGDKKG
jgi:hypothetical protein